MAEMKFGGVLHQLVKGLSGTAEIYPVAEVTTIGYTWQPQDLDAGSDGLKLFSHRFGVLKAGPVVVGHDDHARARQVTCIMGLPGLGAQGARCHGQPEALCTIVSVLLPFNPYDCLTLQ